MFVGLAGILVCSFLGGMKAVTWTQVAQYIILIVAYMIPVVWLSVKHTGIPGSTDIGLHHGIAQSHRAGKGIQRQGLAAREREESVRAILRQRVAARCRPSALDGSRRGVSRSGKETPAARVAA